MKSNNITVQREKVIKNIIPNVTKNLRVDFYLPLANTIIEYNGGQHYEPIVYFGSNSITEAQEKFQKQQDRDSYLQQICNDNNIKLIWIDGREYKNSKLEKYIMENIIPMVKESNK